MDMDLPFNGVGIAKRKNSGSYPPSPSASEAALPGCFRCCCKGSKCSKKQTPKSMVRNLFSILHQSRFFLQFCDKWRHNNFIVSSFVLYEKANLMLQRFKSPRILFCRNFTNTFSSDSVQHFFSPASFYLSSRACG